MNKNNTPTEVINYLVEYFEQFNSLPTNVIECQASGTAYTCFGSNLQNKVEKAGGIEKLLSNFIGRGAKKAQKVEATIEKRTKKKIQVVDTVAGITTEVLA
jgi:hypothetical protein